MVGDAGAARVHVGAAELLGAHVLPGRGLHERRAADEDRPRAVHDHGLVAHRRHVGAAGRARAHHDRDLRDPLRGHARLVVEDPAEVLAVGEDLGLQRQEGAARVDEVDAGEVVLLRDLLRAQMLLDGEREVGAALDGRVVCDDDALLALDDADARSRSRPTARRRRTAPRRRARSARGRRRPGRRVGRSAPGRSASRASGAARPPSRRRRGRRARCARAARRRAPPSARCGGRTSRRARAGW